MERLNDSTVIVCGTGHRPQKFHELGYPKKGLFMLLASVATAWLEERRPATVISGVALGWDQALAYAAIKLGIPTFAYVPCKGQESRWTTKEQEFYHKLLKNCNGIKFCSILPYTKICMQYRNRSMVNCSTEVVALWNGDPGGTGHCVRYAENKGRPITNLWSELEKLKP